MKHTIIQTNTPKEFERKLNDFDENNPAEKYEKRFTQTHVTEVDGELWYTAVIFHNGGAE